MKLSTIIRLVLSLLLLIGVYKETGIWTTISLALIFISSEILTALIRSKR